MKNWAKITTGILFAAAFSLLSVIYLQITKLQDLLYTSQTSLMENHLPFTISSIFLLCCAYLLLYFHYKNAAQKLEDILIEKNLLEGQDDDRINIHRYGDSKLRREEELCAQKEQEDKERASRMLGEFREELEAPFGEVPKAEKILKDLCNKFETSLGALYLKREDESLELSATYSLVIQDANLKRFSIGEGFVGQAAKENKIMNIRQVPENYVKVYSGLGSSTPSYLFILPIRLGDECAGVIELASFREFTSYDEEALNVISGLIADSLFPKMKKVANE